jgi:mannosyltransferase
MRIFHRLTTPAYLAAAVALAVVVRFWHIAQASIWHDEGYTMMLAPMGVIEILERTARDVHPPLYYLVLHFWMALFGNSEISARGLSAICLVACVPLAYALVRRLYDDNTARVAALLVALGPFLVRYGQEARMYGLVALLVLGATYALVRALEHNSRRWWIVYAVTLAAALYTHYYAIFIILVHWLYVAAQTNRSKRRGLFNPWWWGANVGAALLFVPWLPTAYAQFSRVQQSFWIPAVSTTTLPDTLLQLSVFHNLPMIPPAAKVAIAIGFLVLALAPAKGRPGRYDCHLFSRHWQRLQPSHSPNAGYRPGG